MNVIVMIFGLILLQAIIFASAIYEIESKREQEAKDKSALAFPVPAKGGLPGEKLEPLPKSKLAVVKPIEAASPLAHQQPDGDLETDIPNAPLEPEDVADHDQVILDHWMDGLDEDELVDSPGKVQRRRQTAENSAQLPLPLKETLAPLPVS